jgi:hypothetical protein
MRKFTPPFQKVDYWIANHRQNDGKYDEDDNRLYLRKQ